MSMPMAVLEMEPMEKDTEEAKNPEEWTWKPAVSNWDRLPDALKASQNTSRNTTSSQIDHGENK
jgi:hypothetical protein